KRVRTDSEQKVREARINQAILDHQKQTSIQRGVAQLKITDAGTGNVLTHLTPTTRDTYPVTKFNTALLVEKLNKYNNEHDTIYSDEDVKVFFSLAHGGCYVAEGNNFLFSLEKNPLTNEIPENTTTATTTAPAAPASAPDP